MLKIVIVGGYAERYISKCLDSICGQTETDWEAQVVLDPVGDRSYENALHFASDKIKIKLNTTQQFGLHNIIDAINFLNPADEDIILTVDADDWLSCKDSLKILKDKYAERSNTLLTHGSWVGYPNSRCVTNNSPYSLAEFIRGVRHVNWKGSHLRSFKYKLWKHVRDADLKYIDGQYYDVAWDLAMMWPMMEMAGLERMQFIPDILYVYNLETPHNDCKTKLKKQMTYTNHIAHSQPYSYRETF